MFPMIKMHHKLKKAATFVRFNTGAFGRYDRIFLISHMRARSTALSHVLGSHPNISGYFEQHICHQKKLSGLRLRASLLEEGLISSSTHYLFDNTLHDHLDPLSETPDLRIFLFRRPAPTVASIIAMGQSRNTLWQNEDNAFSYYGNRLQSLSAQILTSRRKVVLLKSEDMVSRTDEVLSFLTEFLSLEVPLNSNYASFEKTGRAVSGDPSAAIKAGQIIKTTGDRNIVLNPELLAQADEIYAQFLAKMTNMSHTVLA